MNEDNECESPLICKNNGNDLMSLSMTSSVTSESGLGDKYDPFLSAKRQLEDLCSPLATNDSLTTSAHAGSQLYPPPPQNTNKMTTSLTLSTSTPNSSPLTASHLQNRPANLTLKPSNFRRTSSLRCPRRSPLLPTRQLLTQTYRPTIQRGLSDEGPISSNFLKPEEFDEMPVRSVCVNDYAITNSPRVLRRDTSASNRKNSLKLSVSTAPAVGPTTPGATAVDAHPTSPSKYVSKTDSLAVFLKYETELEKLNQLNSAPSQPSQTKPVVHSPSPTTPTQAVNSPVFTKEFKDKSNTLSKQNSAKSIKLDGPETPSVDVQDTKLSASKTLFPTPLDPQQKAAENPNVGKENIGGVGAASKLGQIRLEPIAKPEPIFSKPTTPLSKPSTPLSAKSALPVPTHLPSVGVKPINLHSIFGDMKPNPSLAFNKERKLSTSTEFIDPKLINKCDNLPVNLTSIRSHKHSESDRSEQRSDSSSSSNESKNAGPKAQLTKLLPLTKTEPAPVSNSPAQSLGTSSVAHTNQRNSSENRNLLKRKIRLGRNQFLYDASPEADSCSADDEANRSSVEYDDQQFSPNSFTDSAHHPCPTRPKSPPNIQAMPIFDDFDFEEFLSSFENDEEDFPLFKDCREFLLNRSSNKQRSTNKTTATATVTNQTPTQSKKFSFFDETPGAFPRSRLHFDFPNLTSRPTNPHPLNSSTHSNESTLASRGLKKPITDLSEIKLSARSSAQDSTSPGAESENKKREIFISIETEHNDDLGQSPPISPDSLRHMVGNPRTMVEVEVDAKDDNKFSKISDDDDHKSAPIPVSRRSSQRGPFNNLEHLPTVQLNNAKNLMQKMQNDFRNRGDGIETNPKQLEEQDGHSGGTSPHSNNGNSGGRRDETFVCDSDEMSSLDGYPMSTQSSRRGVGSKLSADSAYGSLSRQRSTESTHRSLSRSRPATATSGTNTIVTPMINVATQHQQQLQQQQKAGYKSTAGKGRSRKMSGSSSSGSDRSLPPVMSQKSFPNNNCPQPLAQPQQSGRYDNVNNNNGYDLQGPSTASAIQEGHSTTALHSECGSSNVSMSGSFKMSKFCHECGSRFVVEQAKFCMDCGVRRIVL